MKTCKTEMAKDELYDNFPLVIHGTDQTTLYLPSFVTLMKDQRRYGFQINLIGVLEHASAFHFRIFTMTNSHSFCTNHVVESVYRVIKGKEGDRKLAHNFFLQLDNCT